MIYVHQQMWQLFFVRYLPRPPASSTVFLPKLRMVLPWDVADLAKPDSSSVVHRALCMDDIVYEVLHYLAVPVLPPRSANTLSQSTTLVPGGSRSLARLARTCRAFSHIAIKLLWRRLPSLTPLFSLLAPLRVVWTDGDKPEAYPDPHGLYSRFR